MTNTDLLPATVLRRKAVVYVRQSTQTQVQTNLESQRRQYDLVEEARASRLFAGRSHRRRPWQIRERHGGQTRIRPSGGLALCR